MPAGDVATRRRASVEETQSVIAECQTDRCVRGSSEAGPRPWTEVSCDGLWRGCRQGQDFVSAARRKRASTTETDICRDEALVTGVSGYKIGRQYN
jgi:hypothetical protein